MSGVVPTEICSIPNCVLSANTNLCFEHSETEYECCSIDEEDDNNDSMCTSADVCDIPGCNNKQLWECEVLGCNQPLVLSALSLSGTIPGAIVEKIPSVSQLYLNYNDLTGELPQDSILSPTLSLLSMTGNYLHGPVPTNWCTRDPPAEHCYMGGMDLCLPTACHVYSWCGVSKSCEANHNDLPTSTLKSTSNKLGSTTSFSFWTNLLPSVDTTNKEESNETGQTTHFLRNASQFVSMPILKTSRQTASLHTLESEAPDSTKSREFQTKPPSAAILTTKYNMRITSIMSRLQTSFSTAVGMKNLQELNFSSSTTTTPTTPAKSTFATRKTQTFKTASTPLHLSHRLQSVTSATRIQTSIRASLRQQSLLTSRITSSEAKEFSTELHAQESREVPSFSRSNTVALFPSTQLVQAEDEKLSNMNTLASQFEVSVTACIVVVLGVLACIGTLVAVILACRSRKRLFDAADRSHFQQFHDISQLEEMKI